MKTALITFCALAGVLAGCGGGGGSTETAGSTSTDPSTTQNPSSSDPGTGTSSPTTGTPDTTGTPGTDTTNPATTTTEPPPGETTAGESTVGESTVGETGETTKGETTDPDTTTGVEPGGQCMDDKDCTLLSDCCVCEAIAVGDPVPPCNVPECFVPQCDSLGIDEAFCRFGTCVTEKLNCDSSMILCDSLPPDCPAGQLPGVEDNNSCWTGGCVPISACNFVSSCADCPKDQMCVIDETMFGPLTRCEPIPPECMGEPTCGCAGDACDNQPFDTCAEQPNGLHCSCPVC